GNFMVERLMDRLARRLGVDPAELRQRNLIGPERMPYTTGYKRMGTRPVIYDGGDYPRLLASALEAIGYADVRQRQATGARIGVGVACCVESAGIQQPEPATIRVQPNGDVYAYLGSTPGGQGHRTVFAQVIAEHLGWPVDRVQVFVGDTTMVSNSANTAGSRSALEVGNAAAAVAREARRQLVQRAQTALEAAGDDLTIGPRGAEVAGAPAQHVGLAELLAAEGPLTAHASFQSSGAYTAAVHAVTLELDSETATPRITRYVIAHDCGQPINPLLVNGQLQGGLVHGVGYALMEEAAYQPDGTFTTANFLDYALPGRGIPASMQPEIVEVRAAVLGNNPEGFKGVGETGTIAAPAAIVAAIEDALRTAGVDVALSTLPVTPARLFDALASSKGASSSEEMADSPNTRLAAYGTLMPGQLNHALLADVSGTWIDGRVHGVRFMANGFPAFTPGAGPGQVAVSVLTSAALPQHWARLDAFEGTDYRRMLVPVRLPDGTSLVANIYAYIGAEQPLPAPTGLDPAHSSR
ncbi:MAG: molybdopterin cofactor-binding domain-containing protein, partial [Chloroflexota bacterium]